VSIALSSYRNREDAMTIPQAVLAGFAMMAVSILIIGGSSAPQAQAHQFLFMSNALSSSNNEHKAFVAWRMNTATGSVSYCMAGNIATGPACSAWSK
jgi:hypothetical protein